MQTGNAAVNILLDVALTIQATTGGDDGTASGRSTSGSAVTFLADKMTVKAARQLQDHSAGGDTAEFMRTQKISYTATVETKLAKKASAALLGGLLGATGIIVQFTATATGAVVSGTAIVEDIEMGYDIPSTLKFTMRGYGSAWTIANT